MVDVHGLVYAVKCFPENTPRRWQLISQLISYSSDDGGTFVEVGLPSTNETGKLFVILCCRLHPVLSARLIFIVINNMNPLEAYEICLCA